MTWRLLYALKNMGLTPDIIKLPALAYYDPDDLPLSQQLLCTYAQSSRFQMGLNTGLSGAIRHRDFMPADQSWRLKCYVFGDRSWLEDNLGRTYRHLSALRNRASIQRHHTQKYDLDGLEAAMQNLQVCVQRGTSKAAEYAAVMKQVHEKLQEK